MAPVPERRGRRRRWPRSPRENRGRTGAACPPRRPAPPGPPSASRLATSAARAGSLASKQETTVVVLARTEETPRAARILRHDEIGRPQGRRGPRRQVVWVPERAWPPPSTSLDSSRPDVSAERQERPSRGEKPAPGAKNRPRGGHLTRGARQSPAHYTHDLLMQPAPWLAIIVGSIHGSHRRSTERLFIRSHSEPPGDPYAAVQQGLGILRRVQRGPSPHRSVTAAAAFGWGLTPSCAPPPGGAGKVRPVAAAHLLEDAVLRARELLRQEPARSQADAGGCPRLRPA